ncbi:MAG: hypothetical protein AAB488_00555 [Patescibacteria group bacterium]
MIKFQESRIRGSKARALLATDENEVLLAETKRGEEGKPVVVRLEPAHQDIVIVVLHDRPPKENLLEPEQFAEHGDALGLNDEPVLQVESRHEGVVIFGAVVDDPT